MDAEGGRGGKIISKGHKDNPLTPQGELTTTEKKRILLNNIFGVDLDSNAVEVTKLSLLLKCMEGETKETIEAQTKIFHDRILPTLDNNIKSGNSLIDLDYYNSVLDFGEERKIKPFSWQKNFPEVFDRYVSAEKPNAVKFKEEFNKAMKTYKDAMESLIDTYVKEPEHEYKVRASGFDCVIGNPPYVMLQNLNTRDVFDYTSRKYQSAKYKIDTYQLFTERAINILKNNGLLGFITPNTFLKNIHSEPLRKFILSNAVLKEFLLFNYSVFASASVDTCIFILQKGKATENNKTEVNISDIPLEIRNVATIKQSIFEKNNRTDFNLLISDDDSHLLNKLLGCSIPLGNLCGAYFGIQTFDRATFVSKTKVNNEYEPVIDGGNIEPYNLKPVTEFVHYIPTAIKSGGSENIYRQDRICIRQIGITPIATFVPANIFTLNTIYNVYLKDNEIANLKFLLGIVNSNCTKFFWKKTHSDEKKTFPKIKKEAILSIPIPIITQQNKNLHDNIVNLVDQLLQFNKDLQTTTLPEKAEQLKQRIEYNEDRINEIVYELYGLTEDEVKIIETA